MSDGISSPARGGHSTRNDGTAWAALALLLCSLALARPVDHDESQYVAAAVLTAHGLLPYRDYAYLQAPLQPFLFAPIAWAAGVGAWPALRIANALLGSATLFFTWRAARSIAPARIAWATTALFACCDIFLFSVGTARNDALPAACLAAALWLAVGAERGKGTRPRAALAGLLLAAAAAAKANYAIPALAYGLWAVVGRRRHRPGWVALGALPVAAFVLATAATAPLGFLFGVVTFPTAAPADYYAGRGGKLSGWTKLFDMLKFLALGPALPAAVAGIGRIRPAMLFWLTVAGLAAALVPTPTWRQYLLPMLPPLFVMLALTWARRAPGAVARVVFVTFAAAGLAPTAVALAGGRPAMLDAWRDGEAIGAVLARAHVVGPIATLSPQFLPRAAAMPDPRFATGPFYFRSRRLAPPPGLPLLARGDLARAPLPPTVLAGGEAGWSSGDARLDAALEAEVARRGYRRVAVAGTSFRLWLRP